MNREQLQIERLRIWTEMRQLVDAAREAKRGMNAAERERYDTLDRALTEKDEECRIAERDEALMKRDAELVAASVRSQGEPGKADAPGSARTSEESVEQRHERVFAAYLRDGMGGMDQVDAAWFRTEMRAQAVGTPTAGGHLAPKQFIARLREAVKSFGGLLPLVETLNTTDGNIIEWPTANETAALGTRVAENTQITELDVAVGIANLGAHMYTSRIVRAPFQLLQDAEIDFEGWLVRRLAERIARILNLELTRGAVGGPQGIVDVATGVDMGGAGTAAVNVTWKNLVDLEHTVDPAYRARGQYMFHDLMLAQFRKAEDSTGRPLWVPAVSAAAPATVNGYGYAVNNDLVFNTTVVDTPLVFFGDFNAAYVHRAVTGAGLLRLTERYAEFLQVGFLSYERHDGKVQDAQAVKKLIV